MKRISILLVALATVVGMSHAGVVTVDRSFAGADNVVSGNNLGGLNVNNAVLLDSDARGRLLCTIEDSADTGAIFTAVLHITGKNGSSEAEGYRTSTGDDGRIFFRDNSLTREITLNIVDITETTTTGYNISFDGFTKLDLGTSWTVATDQLNIAGTDYDGASDPSVGGILTLDALAASGTVVDHAGTDVIVKGIGTQWTISVPEPATIGMIAVFGGGLLFVRRRLVM